MKQRFLVRGLSVLSLLLGLSPACSKNNDVKINGGAGAACADGTACDGSCVEGVCRAFCDVSYSCSDNAKCVTIDNAAVCMPPDARTYSAYAPLDLLTGCSGRDGCEVALDALPIEGVFQWCITDGVTSADVLNPAFDYAAACHTIDGEVAGGLHVKGRSIFRVQNGKCQDVSVMGAAGPGTLVEACRPYDTEQRGVAFWRLVESGGSKYLWSGGPRPHTGPGADDYTGSGWYFELWKLTQAALPASTPKCELDINECSLPSYPRIGGPASQFAGMWVECSAQRPEDCEKDWDQAALNQYRRVYYIRPDGFGEVMQKGGTARDPKPATCSTAFRMGPEEKVLILGHHDFPIGELDFQTVSWAPAPLPIAGGEFIGEGVYQDRQFNVSRFFKRVQIPADFKDPCEQTRPSFKF